MPLVPATIEQQIDALLNSTASLELEQAKEQFKKQLALIIINAIKSATLTIPPAAIVTVGSPSTQSNVAPVVVVGGLT